MMKKYTSHALSIKRNHFRFLISGLLLFFIFTGQSSADEPERNKIRTVVIDPGHGGKDPDRKSVV